jgi:hypothetical protein
MRIFLGSGAVPEDLVPLEEEGTDRLDGLEEDG